MGLFGQLKEFEHPLSGVLEKVRTFLGKRKETSFPGYNRDRQTERCQVIMGLERGALIFVRIIEELLDCRSS
jgi:hypothetical protein